jgi:hypothetical protein
VDLVQARRPVLYLGHQAITAHPPRCYQPSAHPGSDTRYYPCRLTAVVPLIRYGYAASRLQHL